MVEPVNKLHTPTTQLTSTLWVRPTIYCLSWERTACKWDDFWLKSIVHPKCSLSALAKEVSSSNLCLSHNMKDSSMALAKEVKTSSVMTEHIFNQSSLLLCAFIPQIPSRERRGQFCEQFSLSFSAHSGISKDVSWWGPRNTETSLFLLMKGRQVNILDSILIASAVRWKTVQAIQEELIRPLREKKCWVELGKWGCGICWP